MVTIEIQGQFSKGTTDMCGTLLRQNITQKGHMQGSSHTASYPLQNHKALCTRIYLQGKRGDTCGACNKVLFHMFVLHCFIFPRWPWVFARENGVCRLFRN